MAEIDAIEKSLKEGTFQFPEHLRLDGGNSSNGAEGGDNITADAMDVGER